MQARTFAPEETARSAHWGCSHSFFPWHGGQLAHPECFRSCCILRSTLLAQALMPCTLSNMNTFGSKVREKVSLVCYHAATEPSYH